MSRSKFSNQNIIEYRSNPINTKLKYMIEESYYLNKKK